MQIPIFPLNGAVLYPETNLPLNIFEDRYIEMVDFALSEDQLKARVEGVIYGARLVSITPIGGETYETKLSLDQKTVNEIIENYLGGRKAKARTRDAEIRARRLITSNETR